eukprot:SAG25_NODE_352_length_9272_cov_9.627385_7_plen_139_part_00
MRMLLDSKIKQGKFERAKGRTVAQGHKGNLRKGFDYDTVFCAALALESNRLIQATIALFGWTRCTYDINQAYLLGKAEANQRFAMRYPEGRIRESYKINGGETFAIQQTADPLAKRVTFPNGRDSWLAELSVCLLSPT